MVIARSSCVGQCRQEFVGEKQFFDYQIWAASTNGSTTCRSASHCGSVRASAIQCLIANSHNRAPPLERATSSPGSP